MEWYKNPEILALVPQKPIPSHSWHKLSCPNFAGILFKKVELEALETFSFGVSQLGVREGVS